MAKGMWIGANGTVTLKNLLDGGKFKDTTYWTASNATYTVSGFVATVTSTGNWASLYRDVDTTNGHIYYARIRVKYATTTSHYGAMLAFKTRSNLGGSSTASVRATKFDGTWQSISVRTTLNYADARVLLYNPYTSSGTAMTDFTVQWNQPLLIDLTACFGAGKEPTKEWCDSNISFFDSTTIANNPNVSNVARSIKDLWIGIDSVGYRLLVNVSQGEKINIGGNLFTVVSHGKGADGFANETLLWSDTPTGQAKWTDIFEWGKSTGVDSAFNTTITNMAIKKSNGYKFYVLTDERDLSGLSGIRYSNGTAVNHWMSDTGVAYELVEEVTGKPGEWVGVSKYTYGPYYFYYWDTSGTKKTISCGGPGDEDVDPVYPGSTYYYFYACKISGDTKVTYDSVNGYYKLYT